MRRFLFCLLILLAVMLSIDNGQWIYKLVSSEQERRDDLKDFIFEKKRKDES
jgi:hypothetical protein